MDFLSHMIDVFLHIDEYLGQIISQYGTLTYLILFAIIFIETGVVILPFLPGDSLLFAAGTFASPAMAGAGEKPPLNIIVLIVLLCAAAILGDTANYWIGHRIGPRAFTGSVRFLKKEHLDRTHAFFEKYGGKTIVLARFVPIVRTFAPFVAGVGEMSYGRFISYNVIGGISWGLLFTLAGYFFGNLKVVQEHFELVVVAIVLISVMPAVYEYIKGKRAKPVEIPDSLEEPSTEDQISAG
jgi:membrane-associated protein